MITVMVGGSRTITDIKWVFTELENYLRELYQKHKDPDFKIIEGGAKGVDQMAVTFAIKHNCRCKEYPADWDKYGKSAGPRRNQQMVVDCDYCILFWDGKSRGTKNDIDLCKKYNKPYKLLVEGEIGARN